MFLGKMKIVKKKECVEILNRKENILLISDLLEYMFMSASLFLCASHVCLVPLLPEEGVRFTVVVLVTDMGSGTQIRLIYKSRKSF